jgi:hypothetical protein
MRSSYYNGFVRLRKWSFLGLLHGSYQEVEGLSKQNKNFLFNKFATAFKVSDTITIPNTSCPFLIPWILFQ